MIHIEKEQILEIIPRLKSPLEQYLWIQNEITKRNVSIDREFQRRFNGFYRVRRNSDWQKDFYQLMESSKNKNVSFGEVLDEMYKRTGKMEASFVSKLIATINPEMPIIDKIVFDNLGLTLPSTGIKNRDLIIKGQYQTLINELCFFLQTENGKYLIEQFIKRYPETEISKIKMLDFVIWQIRN
ncbi:MAG TPA: hypothetical protein PLD14_01695 [Candidatus Pacearchaeota archaeon]|nr:hypothetical protein [Candidatus Pacearchaeota archaeon]HPR79912.1 hypothetical protein [Candidatus Pacearchaeota archaeon]